MVLCLLPSFATFGGGGIVEHLEDNHPQGQAASVSQANAVGDLTDKKPGASINEAASWENMANFIVAIAFLWVGIEQVQKLGVRGGGLTSGAIDFGKKVATIASGYAAGRWLVDKGADIGGKAIKGAAYYAPAIGGEKWEKRAQIIGNAAKGWYYGKGFEVTKEAEDARDKLSGKKGLYALQDAKTKEGQKAIKAEIAELNGEREKVEESAAAEIAAIQASDKKDEDKEKAIQEVQMSKDDELNKIAQEVQEKQSLLAEACAVDENALASDIKEQEEILRKGVGGGIFGRLARSGMGLDKQVGKTVGQAETRKQLLRKRTGSQSGGTVLNGMVQFGMGVERAKLFGIPLGKKFGDTYKSPLRDRDAQDRIEEGWLQAEQARGAAKDYDIQTEGRLEVLRQARLKYNPSSGKIGYEFKKGSMAERIEERKMKGEGYDSDIRLLELQARGDLLSKAEKQMDKIGEMPGIKKMTKQLNSLGDTMSSLEDAIDALKAIEAAQGHIDAYNAHDAEAYLAELKEKNPEKAEEELQVMAKEFGDQLKDKMVQAQKDIDGQRENAREAGVNDEEMSNVQDALKSYESRMQAGAKEAQKIKKQKAKAELAAIEEMGRSGKLPLAWKNARNSALRDHQELFFAGRSKRMVDDAAQRHIWDAKGITTPNNAELEIYESLLKDFQAMDYNAAVAALQDNMKAMTEKMKSGKKIDFEDRAISMVLLKKLHQDSWIDDGIIPTADLQKLGIDISEDMAEQVGAELSRQLASLKAARRKSGGGIGGGSGPSMKSLAQVMKDALGTDTGSFIQGLKNNNAGESARLLNALRSGISGVQGAVLRQAGLDATKTTEQLAKEVQEYIVRHHKSLAGHI